MCKNTQLFFKIKYWIKLRLLTEPVLLHNAAGVEEDNHIPGLQADVVVVERLRLVRRNFLKDPRSLVGPGHKWSKVKMSWFLVFNHGSYMYGP